MIGIEQALEAPGAEYADVETGAENCSETLQSKEWEVNFSKNMDIASNTIYMKILFCIFLWSDDQPFFKFYCLLLFSPCLY